jgi:signal peptidase I
VREDHRLSSSNSEKLSAPKPTSPKRAISPVALVIALALTLTFFRLFVVDVMQVEGSSMEPTFRRKQIILVNKVSYGIILPFKNRYLLMWSLPQPGEIVVFRFPGQKKAFVKRCVAEAGDSVSYRDGYLYLRDLADPLSIQPTAEILERDTVPEGHILVVGDNHQNSIDSRSLGFVNVERVFGKVIRLTGPK